MAVAVKVKKVVVVSDTSCGLEYRIEPECNGISVYYKDSEELTMFMPYEFARAFNRVMFEMLDKCAGRE